MVNRGSRHERSSNHGTEEALAMSGAVASQNVYAAAAFNLPFPQRVHSPCRNLQISTLHLADLAEGANVHHITD